MDKASTCDLGDLHKGDGSGGFRVLPPVFHDYGGRPRFAGPVRTVRCFEDISSVKALLATPGDGAVLVVDGAASFAQTGWAGVVINGAVRDRAELAACDVGLRALALIPLPTERKHDGDVDQPLQMQGVWIRPGDWLVADEDGIVVLTERP